MTIETTSYETPPQRTPRRARSPRASGKDALATGLGLFSVGLGLAELFAPKTVARAIGVREAEPNTAVLRAAGARELASGLAILGGGNPTGWLRARVGGDVMDLALLGAAFCTSNVKRTRLTLAAGSVLAVTALDALSSYRASHASAGAEKRRPEHAVSARVHDSGLFVRKAITVHKPVSQVYGFWRELENLPRFMRHLESVEVLSADRSRFRLRGPAGANVAWDAETLIDEPSGRIAWRSLPGADLEHVGDIRFQEAPGGRGTEVHVVLRYRAPGGAAGRAIAKLLKFLPKHELESDLRAFKQLLETGEILRSDASVHRLPHPARAPTPDTKPALSSQSGTLTPAEEGGAR